MLRLTHTTEAKDFLLKVFEDFTRWDFENLLANPPPDIDGGFGYERIRARLRRCAEDFDLIDKMRRARPVTKFYTPRR
jgi:hypothetical protein